MIQDDRCYFILEENPDYPKYNACAGQVVYLNEYTVVTRQFEDDGEVS